MDEVGLRDTVDPLAGSYFIETLTKQMEEKIWEEMREIEERGGMVACVADGYVQRKVAWQAYEFERDLQKGDLVKVGVNKYATADEEDVDLHEYNEEWCDQQLEGLKEVRATRDASAVASSLKELERVARAGENVMPTLVQCCLAYATVGEMADVFREAFGTFKEPSIF
jgi:methylmalonyl-CoA mutase, N-terminal domain